MGGETTRVWGAKRLGLKIEAKRLGGKRLGGEMSSGRNVLLPFGLAVTGHLAPKLFRTGSSRPKSISSRDVSSGNLRPYLKNIDL